MQNLDNLTFDDDASTPAQLIVSTPGAEEGPRPSGRASPNFGKIRPAVWKFLVEHPNCTSVEVSAAVQITPSDASNALRAFVERKAAERVRVDGLYVYSATKSTYPGEAKVVRKRRSKRPQVQQTSPPEQVHTGVTPDFTASVQTFINQLNVHQAKAVYEELHKVFGG